MKKLTRKKGTALFQMWLTPEEKAILRQEANDLGVSMSDILRTFIDRMGGYAKSKKIMDEVDKWSEGDE